MTRSDVLAIGGVIAAALVMLALLAACKRSLKDSEALRKLAHIGTGALAILFPWLFSSLLPVVAVCGLSLLLLLAIATVPYLRTRLGGSMYAVDRVSFGEFYFPVSVAILFWLAQGDKLLYVVPLLVLTFADAAAAILGTTYGRVAYSGAGGKKSVEGSAVFFTIAFFAVHVPLLVYSQLSRPQTLLVAVDIALVVTLLEAIAWRGLDNIFIPLGGFLLLHIYTTLSVQLLFFRLIAAVLLLAGVLLYRSRTTLEASGLIASALTLYASWGAGGWQWFMAPAVLFGVYSFFLPRSILQNAPKDSVYAVSSIAAAGLLWLFLAKVNGLPQLIFPYFTAYAVHLAILAWSLKALQYPLQNARKRGPVLVLKTWALIFVPYVFVEGVSILSAERALLALAVCALAFVVFCVVEPRHEGLYAVDGWRWVRQAGLVIAFTAPLAFVRGPQ